MTPTATPNYRGTVLGAQTFLSVRADKNVGPTKLTTQFEEGILPQNDSLGGI